MKILISAAEASSDAHGAELLRAIRKLLPESTTLEAFGIGGPKLQAEGLQTVVDARQLLAMGFTEILGRLPQIKKALSRLTEVARSEKPDVVVLIDYPDFHLRLANRVHGTGIPLVYYIPPKVWVWRKRRLRQLKTLFSKLLCILPFEKDFYAREGVPAVYVGNPLVDELPLELSRKEARDRLDIPSGKVLVLMPGSRPSELKRHLRPFIEAASILNSEAQGGLKLLMPLPETANLSAIRHQAEEICREFGSLGIRVSQGNSSICLRAADAALVKSGTSTLEAALLGAPHVIAYRPSPVSTWIVRNLVRYTGPVGLTNLVAGKRVSEEFVAKELLHEQVSGPELANALRDLLNSESPQRKRMEAELLELRRNLVGGADAGGASESPSLRAAKEVLEVAGWTGS